MRLVLAAALAVTAAVPAAAATYDAFASFTGTNTGGAYTYGVLDDTNDGAVFTPYNDTPGCAALISNVICTSNGFLPAAFKSTSGAHQSSTVIVPGDALILHPGANAGESSALVFTVPTTSLYTLSFSAFVADNNPSGTILEIFLPNDFTIPFAELTAASPSFSSGTGVVGTLDAGEQIGFAVNYDGVYYDDSTGINVTFTAVPEPATWGLMVVGFGLISVANRRRKAALAALVAVR